VQNLLGYYYYYYYLCAVAVVADLEFLLMILSMKHFYQLSYLDSHRLLSHLLHFLISA